jgi:hypothetical protein
MTNSSDTFKTGEKAVVPDDYICLDCLQSGRSTTIHVEAGAIFPHCETCETRDATYRMASTVVGN